MRREMVAPGQMVGTPAGLLALRKMPNEWFVLEIRGERHVPEYDPAEVGRGMSQSTFRREVLGDWTASTGKLVYPEFGDIHCATKSLPFDHTLPLVLGWDLPAATGGTKAMVPTQVNKGGQWLVYPPLVEPRDRTMGVYEFGEWVAQHLHEEFAEPNGVDLADLHLIHYADPAGAQKPLETVATRNSRTELRSAFEILLLGEKVTIGYDEHGRAIIREKPGFGWVMHPGAVSITERQAAIRARLTTLFPGATPAMLVDPAATLILEGFKGAYNYPERGDGQYEHDPCKNYHSHPMNALEYPATRLFAARPKREDDDEGMWRRPTTRAVGRRWERS